MISAILLSQIAGFGFFYSLHVILWRARPSNAPRIILMTFLILLSLPLEAAVAWFLSDQNPSAAVAALSFGVFGLICYMYVYSGISRAVSLTLLARLHKAGATPVELTVLVAEYAGSSRFVDRLAVMKDVGFLAIDGDRVRITDKGRRMGQFVKLTAAVVSGNLEG